MKVEFHRDFLKIYIKRFRGNFAVQTKFKDRTRLFEKNSADPVLEDHPLKGKKIGSRAFSIGGDIRVVYRIENGVAYFMDIGSHNQVY